jgi:tRNA pseudouridine55 synthase
MDSGFLLINKPKGITSHDVIDRLRRITGVKKIGHAGTLDPLASGLMIVAVGRSATKEINRFVKLDKTYIAELTLGQKTNTYDAEGEIEIVVEDLSSINDMALKEVLDSFKGKQKQIPPMFSAKKVGGRKLYHLARAGEEIERPAQEIEIFDILLKKVNLPQISFKTRVSSGTYIRTLANDIGEKLGVGAYMSELARTQVDNFKLIDASRLDELNTNNWREKLLNL